ncbi:hypothetical protein [Roseisalinus antarcticus]|uniref:Dihydrodipicolinate reductase n=1 Tax=Roseisalinus antarcticus TaxID=254357 RepID=A0A1Y5SL65_9RHOB|nr:hypothetical protein [Roseisalinus antarcticus]SLN43405.1 hypothetical protein ROA7023_01771 [Roseisalinus antarcticus]
MKHLDFVLALALAFALPAAPALAEFAPIRDRASFVATVQGRELAIPLLGIALAVRADGSIGGSAQGQAVTGTWSWDAGYFCRTLSWGSRSWPLNCQLVETDGNRVRFTADRGTGDQARFALR